MLSPADLFYPLHNSTDSFKAEPPHERSSSSCKAILGLEGKELVGRPLAVIKKTLRLERLPTHRGGERVIHGFVEGERDRYGRSVLALDVRTGGIARGVNKIEHAVHVAPGGPVRVLANAYDDDVSDVGDAIVLHYAANLDV